MNSAGWRNGILLGACSVWLLLASTSEAGVLAEATLTGKVTSASTGAPIGGARIEVDVVATLNPSAYGFLGGCGGFFNQGLCVGHTLVPLGSSAGASTVISTSNAGEYAATLTIPDNVPERHLYLRIVVAKLSGPPGYSLETALVPVNGVAGNTRAYRQDMRLQDLTASGYYVAFVTGTIRDRDSKERLQNIILDAIPDQYGFGTYAFGRIALPNADGTYVGVLFWEPGAGNTRVYAISNSPGPKSTVKNGLAYLTGTQQRTFTSSGKLVVDLMLPPQPIQTTVIGRLTNASTGKPIPNALVELKVGTNRPEAVWRSSSMTDLFGRYQLVVNWIAGYNAYVQSIQVSTNGAYLSLSDPSAPYQSQTAELIGRFREGDIYQYDFSLVPR